MRRCSVLLEVLSGRQAVASLAAQWQISDATIYDWTLSFMTQGGAGLTYRSGAGRRPKLTPLQKQRLGQLLDGGPQACGFATACWSSVLVAELIQREFGVLYNRFYVCTLLRNLGYSFQKARFVAAHLDQERRQRWMAEVWPQLLRQAKRRQALILFGDEVSFAQWGSLSYTWARQGQTPEVPTSGKRKAYKVFGLIEFFSGRLFYQGLPQRLPATEQGTTQGRKGHVSTARATSSSYALS